MMGTNYYWYPEPPCVTCGRLPEKLHIGRAAANWVFALHVEEPGSDVPATLSGWKVLFDRPGSFIADEYGRALSAEEMLAMIKGCAALRRRSPHTGICAGQNRERRDPEECDLVKGEFR